MSKFSKAKDLFIDERTDDTRYIALESSERSYNALKELVRKPLKMILLFGLPGTGKSMLMQRVYSTLSRTMTIYYFNTPSFDPFATLPAIFFELTGERMDPPATINDLIRPFSEKFKKGDLTVMLDEAQLYNGSTMETIRLLSDTRIFKFIIAVHKTEDEELIAKGHFTTRIWETLEIHPVPFDELKMFIEKKLIIRNLYHILQMFQPSNFKLIYTLTGGNLREVNKLIYKTFEICDYLETNRPHKLNHKVIENKTIEMAAIALGMIHV